MKIIDEKIAPYEVHVDGTGNYAVVRELPNRNKKGEIAHVTEGYYTSVGNALNKIAKLLVEKEDILTIKEYMHAIRKVEVNILNLGYNGQTLTF
jgi:hypothetical protein